MNCEIIKIIKTKDLSYSDDYVINNGILYHPVRANIQVYQERISAVIIDKYNLCSSESTYDIPNNEICNASEFDLIDNYLIVRNMNTKVFDVYDLYTMQKVTSYDIPTSVRDSFTSPCRKYLLFIKEKEYNWLYLIDRITGVERKITLDMTRILKSMIAYRRADLTRNGYTMDGQIRLIFDFKTFKPFRIRIGKRDNYKTPLILNEKKEVPNLDLYGNYADYIISDGMFIGTTTDNTVELIDFNKPIKKLVYTPTDKSKRLFDTKIDCRFLTKSFLILGNFKHQLVYLNNKNMTLEVIYTSKDTEHITIIDDAIIVKCRKSGTMTILKINQ